MDLMLLQCTTGLEYVTWAKTLRIQVGTIYMVAWGILTTELVSFFIL